LRLLHCACESSIDGLMTLIDAIGAVGGTLTTLCWLPQVRKAWCERDTRSLSLSTLTILSVGVACWVIYGLGTGDLVVIGANGVSLCLILTVLVAKLRYG
jgi:MtN3 and saliva related transmembrane protein